ncbi:MAG: FAD-dependent oxidoreductase [Burkholderiales bacterium]|nr:FAD-dependent oxidoreductase [Burkholderiales bacterium]
MKKAAIAVLATALFAGFIAFDLAELFTLESLRSRQAAIQSYYDSAPLLTALVYAAIYVVVTALSLPGAATVATLAGGAVFGLFWGTVLVSFASSLGATLAFLLARFVLREAVQRRFGERLRAVNEGIERDGAFYLFALRLVPAIPFFAINLLVALTALRTWTFYWVSQLGMLAGTIVYVNAGTQLARIETPSGVLSPALIASFALLAAFPFIARRALDALRSRRALSAYAKPARFDCNLVVIGAGAAGLVCAYIAAAVKAKVVLIEKHRMGGDCLNTGCIPSKALIRSAKLLSHMRRAAELGIRGAQATFDFAEIMQRAQRVIARVAPHDSVERYSGLGVECVMGEATIKTPYSVEVRTASGTRTIATRAIVIAAGARPFIPPIAGIDQVGCLTSENLWELRALPRRLVVLGGGPIGCELAQCFARFGSTVTQVEMMPRLMMREDPDVSQLIAERFRAEGIRVLAGHEAKRFALEQGSKVLYCEHQGAELRIEFDEVLCAVGRVARTQGYGLEALRIAVDRSGTIDVDDYLRTRLPNIFACGDVAGPYQFTHTAAHMAWYATVNALFGAIRKFRVDYRVIPWCTFTDPEVARVGLNETEAAQRGIAHETTLYPLDDLDRAIADGEAHGFVKVLTAPGKDSILGVTIVGEHAGDLIAEYVAAMKQRIGLDRILGTIHVYPTLAEANKHAAGRWKQAHAPAGALRWAERFHGWMRG